MKISSEQRVISVSNNIENVERNRQLSLQKSIDDHYKYDVIESCLNDQYVVLDSKINIQ